MCVRGGGERERKLGENTEERIKERLTLERVISKKRDRKKGKTRVDKKNKEYLKKKTKKKKRTLKKCSGESFWKAIAILWAFSF